MEDRDVALLEELGATLLLALSHLLLVLLHRVNTLTQTWDLISEGTHRLKGEGVGGRKEKEHTGREAGKSFQKQRRGKGDRKYYLSE